MLDRAFGCLVGGAIGDALGAPVEGSYRQEVAITDFLTDAPIGTDDTDYAIFNARLILEHGRELSPADVEASWRRLLLARDAHLRRGGFSDVYAARNLLWGLHAPQSGAFNPQMWSDGVAMAIGAAGIVWPGDSARAADLATRIGCISNARDGLSAGRAVAASVAVAMRGATVDEMIEAALAHIPADSWTSRVIQRGVAAARGGDADAVYNACALDWFPWADIAPEAVGLAFGAMLLGGDSFERVVLTGVNFGRDADTIGAIAGTLAGARLGAEAVPERWRERIQTSSGVCLGVVAGQNIRQTAERLVALVAVS